jgi:hypothetical protein
MLDRIAALGHRVAALERPAVRGPERARPMLDPDDGALQGSGTITTSGQYVEWYTDTTPGGSDSCPTQPVDADRAEFTMGGMP